MGFSRQEYSSEVAIFFSRGSSQTRDWNWVSCTGKQILYHSVTREVHMTSSSVKSSSSIKSVFFLAISLLLNLWYGGGIGHSLAGIWSEMSFTECLQASGFPCLQLAPQGCPDQARGCWKGRSLSSKPFGASSPFLSVWLFVELPRGRTWKGLLITLFRAPEEKLNLSANSAWSRYWRDKISDGLSGTWAIWKLTLWFLWVMRHITERGKKKKTGRQERKKEEGNDLKKNFFLFCIGVFENPLDKKEIKQSIIKEISPEYPLEGLVLKLKLQCFGHLMRRADSLEKTLMLGKTEGGRRRGQQRMRRLDGITDSMDMSLSKLRETVNDRHAAVHRVAKSQTRPSH